jgi:hypothetical protein
MYKDGDMNPCFILLPRKDAIEINSDARDKLVRGSSKTGFGNHKYCCVGSRARRNAPGVESGHFNLDGASKADWNTIVHMVK